MKFKEWNYNVIWVSHCPQLSPSPTPMKQILVFYVLNNKRIWVLPPTPQRNSFLSVSFADILRRPLSQSLSSVKMIHHCNIQQTYLSLSDLHHHTYRWQQQVLNHCQHFHILTRLRFTKGRKVQTMWKCFNFWINSTNLAAFLPFIILHWLKCWAPRQNTLQSHRISLGQQY